jgi:hypothetical protein
LIRLHMRTPSLLLPLLLSCSTLTAQTGLLNTEYFWDADPGPGNGTPLVAVDGSYGQALELVLAQTATLPAPGAHTFSIRARDEDGNWGPVFRTMLEVLPGTLSFPDIQLSEGEYYWDTDPGEGSGSPLFALDGNYNSALEAIGADITSLPAPGLHTLNLRTLDVNGAWSAPFGIVVEVLSGSVSFPTIHVSAAECWFNTDPGFGAGAPLLAADGDFDQALEAFAGGGIPVPVLAGINVLWMRAQDDDGEWGPSFGVVVNMDTTITGTVGVADVPAPPTTFLLAPNPTTAEAGFRIEQLGQLQDIHIRVLDAQGRTVLDQNVGLRARVDIALNGLAPGLYPVGIYRQDGVSWYSVVVR